ncbi:MULTISPECIES: alpha/beta hydrolase [Rhodopseudomonas]|uniref:alpha/beta hydrolase n=1 Tax=Rhodopseudomonas TaxID=1073 RepID=UPI0006967314|nr:MULTISPECIES: alpha/beta hydrolase [Rhodopseudomonas]MDF3810410.1 alpha/beta fold hydrolase [Rhodopseudomonas sp. BAL398]WOK19610.1 alpha/beta fold hydrolase [Rhodopseudomonas sp. BAL398]
MRSRKPQALVAFLALAPGVAHVRERLATLLWPDSSDDAARQSLRQCISKLRRDVPELPLSSESDLIGFEIGAISTDVAEFGAALADPTLANLRRAAALYRGDLLEGFDARSDLFEEWLLGERDRLRAAAISGLRALMLELQRGGAQQEAIAVALRLLAIDPLQEDVERALMRLYADQGQTALALRRYKRCEALLRKELNVEPDQATKSLYQDLLRYRTRRKASDQSAISSASEPAPPSLRQTVRTCTTQDGVRIAYASVGSGPPLVKAANWLNHLEFDLESPVYRHWIEALSRDHTYLRYDERGTGLSDWDVFDFSFDALLRDLETVVEAARLDRFVLLGASQGCAISIAYAVKHPERVSHLVLYGGYAKGWIHLDDPAEKARRQALATLVLEGWGQENPVFRQIFTSLLIPGANDEQIRWFNDLQKLTTSPENAHKLVQEFGAIDVRHLLKDVRVPTLVLHARQDARVKFTEGQELAAGIKGARFVPLDSRNHVILENEPAWSVFVSAVRAFLAGSDRPQPPLPPGSA